MEPAAKDNGRGSIHGLSIRLDDGGVVSLDEVIAEGRRQRARELRKLTRAAFRWIGRSMRPLLSLVPGSEAKHMIPRSFYMDEAMAMAGRGARPGHVAARQGDNLFARLGKSFFQTDAALGHVAGAAAEDIVEVKGEVKGRDDGRRLAA